MIKSLDQTLADNLNELMRTHQLSSNEKVAGATGLGTGTIQRTRRAESSATLKTIESLAQAFRISPSKLLTENLGRNSTEQLPTGVSPICQHLIDRIVQLDTAQASPPALYALIENAIDLIKPESSNGYPGLDKLPEE